MKNKNPFRCFLRREGGAVVIEYALIASGIAGAIAVVVFMIGDDLITAYYERVAGIFQ